MQNVAFSVAREKVENDLDLQEEKIITPDEMIDYFNEGIKEAEADILKIHEDYFLDYENIATVLGTKDYDLPSNIYAMKIRHIMFDNGSDKYEIKRMRNIRASICVDPAEKYCYLPVNRAGIGPQLRFYPTPRETSSTNVTAWFIRHSNRIPHVGDVVSGSPATQAVVDATEIDIPEFIEFVYAWVKMRCLAKYNGGLAPQESLNAIDQQRVMMVTTLSNRTPDENDEIPIDTSFYSDFDSSF